MISSTTHFKVSWAFEINYLDLNDYDQKYPEWLKRDNWMIWDIPKFLTEVGHIDVNKTIFFFECNSKSLLKDPFSIL